MKTSINTILIILTLCLPALAQKPEPIPKNASRKALDAFTKQISESVGSQLTKKPDTTLPVPSLKGDLWVPKWQVSKDGTSMLTRFQPKDNKYLEFGDITVYVTSKPFKAKLNQAPSVQDDGAAIEHGVQRWLTQDWKNVTFPALGNHKLRSYQDAQSGGADNEVHATEPFAVKSKGGKIYWIHIKVHYGYHKTKGLTLQRALNALSLTMKG